MGGSTRLRPISLPGGELSCETRHTSNSTAFEVTSKRRKGFPSETSVKRGDRRVHGGKQLAEKLGRNDLCPCGLGRRFQAILPKVGRYDGALRNYYF